MAADLMDLPQSFFFVGAGFWISCLQQRRYCMQPFPAGQQGIAGGHWPGGPACTPGRGPPRGREREDAQALQGIMARIVINKWRRLPTTMHKNGDY